MGRKKIEFPGYIQADPAEHLFCPWNDHGAICGKRGSVSEGLNGQSPWYCSEHWAKLKGWPVKLNTAKPPSFRERWYAEHNQEYTPAKLDCPLPWQAIGGSAAMRQPGEDTEADVYGSDAV